jgi:hypothetical protein
MIALRGPRSRYSEGVGYFVPALRAFLQQSRADESGGHDQGDLQCFLPQKGYDRGSIWKLIHFSSVISAMIVSPL